MAEMIGKHINQHMASRKELSIIIKWNKIKVDSFMKRLRIN
jgi:hypothetical protein